MSPLGAALITFAGDFALFLMAMAGLACALRRELLVDRTWAQSALACGFLALATGAFLRGSSIVGDADSVVLTSVRIGGGVLVAAGALRWSSGGRARVAVWSGLAILAGAAVTLQLDRPIASAVLRLLGAVLVGSALVSAARRSIPARIGVSAAGLLLVVVLGLSIAVSMVVARNVEHEAIRRYSARAANEADAVVRAARAARTPAKLVAGSLAATHVPELSELASSRPSDPGAPARQAAARVALSAALARLTDDRLLAIHDPVVFVSARGAPEAVAPASLDNTTRLGLAGDPVLADARRAQAERQAVAVVRGQAYAMGVAPVFLRRAGAPDRFGGVVVVARRLDKTYLRVLGRAGEPLSFALVTPTRVLASSGDVPRRSLLDTGRRVVDEMATPSHEVGDRFVAGAPVVTGDQPAEVAFVVSVPSSGLRSTRHALFRNLFVVALGAALVALLLAIAVGERIGLGLRRLTSAAERLRRGDFDAPAQLRSDDELGVLGAAFDSMSSSIRTMTSDLRQAALDEAGLRARLEAVVAGMGEALVAVDVRGTVVELNHAAEDLLRMSRPAAIGRPLQEVMRQLDEHGQITAITPLVWPVTGAGPHAAVPPIELELVDAEGNQVPVSLTVGMLSGPSGEPAGAVLVARDVRREREVEAMKTEFLANISHELRTPLTPIKGYAGVLASRNVSPAKTREYAEEINGSVEQLERIIGQLVNFATMAAGRLAVDVEPLAVRPLLDAIADRWTERVDRRHRISVEVPADVPPVMGDRNHLKQVIDELIDNAVKYSPAGGRITISAFPEVDAGVAPTAPPLVAVTVADEGIGIDPDQLSALVDGFTQADTSATREFGGLGLGLALTDRIVRAHGGRLRFDSQLAAGTQVTLVLRAASGGDPVDAPASPAVDCDAATATATATTTTDDVSGRRARPSGRKTLANDRAAGR